MEELTVPTDDSESPAVPVEGAEADAVHSPAAHEAPTWHGHHLEPGDAHHPDTDRMLLSPDGVLEHDRAAEWQGQPTVRRFPDLFISETTAAVLLLCLYTVLCIFAPAALGLRSNPAITPLDSQPPWYFLFLDKLLHVVPSVVAALTPVILLVLLGAWPFLDRNPSRKPRKRLFALALGATAVIAIVTLTLLGARG
jgi:quinol-cytochrome oxidoreductase complex cytochrome b subunit